MSSNGSNSFANDASLSSWKDNPASHQIASQTATPESLMEKQSSSFPWILHHILEKEPSNELPLRIMFTFNAGQQLPTLKQAHEWWQYEPRAKLIIQFLASLPPSEQTCEPAVKELKEISRKLERISEVTEVGELSRHSEHPKKCEFDQFVDPDHKHLVDIDLADDASTNFGRRTSGFPTQFIRNVCLNKVFLEDYAKADFTQALTCLDYLRDLECTRRTALREAALRLGISKNNWKAILLEGPDAYKWVSAVQKQELAIETSFAASFVDLRIWTMAHELQSTPFYKPNVLAMLNTLFPPAMKDMPNDKVDIKALQKYRATFYHHVLAVEARGTGIVKDFIEKLLEPKAKHSWSETRRHLEEYISLADTMIIEAKAVEGIEYFHDATSSRHSRTISGARSSYSDRPQTASSANTSVDGWLGTFAPPKSPGFTLDSDAKKAGPGIVFDKEIFEPLPTSSIPSEPSKAFSALSFRERAANAGGVKATTSSLSASPKGILTKQSPLSITIPPPKSHVPSNPSPLGDPDMRRKRSTLGSSPTTSTQLESKDPRNPPDDTATKKGHFQTQFDFLTRPFTSQSSESSPVEGVKRKKSIGSFLLRRKPSVGPSSSSTPTHARSSSDGDRVLTGEKNELGALNRGRAMSTVDHTDPGDGRPGLKNSLTALNARNGGGLPPPPPPSRGMGMGVSPGRMVDRIDDSADVSTKLDALGFALIDLSFRDSTTAVVGRRPGSPGDLVSPRSVPLTTDTFTTPNTLPNPDHSAVANPLNGTPTGRTSGMRKSAAPAPLNVRKARREREEEGRREWGEFEGPRVAPRPPEGGQRTVVVLDLGRFGGRF